MTVRVRDKNDSPPSWEKSQLEYSLSEDTGTGERVGKLEALDPDTIGETRYTLVSGGEGRFSLAEDGILILKDSVDREEKDRYHLRVRASDGLQASEAVITVIVSTMTIFSITHCVYYNIKNNSPLTGRVDPEGQYV